MERNINQYSFIVDAMLGKIARKLRIFGFDTVYESKIDDMDILNSSKYYGRIVLTSDRVLFRRCKKKGLDTILMDKRTEVENLVTIFRSLDIESINSQKLPHFCTCCNGLLDSIIDKNSIKNKIPDRLLHTKDIFYKCSQCNKIYWIGSHMERIACLIREINMRLQNMKFEFGLRYIMDNMIHKPQCLTYQRTMKCPCCGEDLIREKETEKIISYSCLSCGLKNSELKKTLNRDQ